MSAPAPAPDQSSEEAVLQSLCGRLKKVADQRSPQGKVHQLHGVLCLVVVGLLTGNAGLSRIIAFAMGHGARRRRHIPGALGWRGRRRPHGPEPARWLRDIGLVWRGVPTAPSLQTLINILGSIRPRDLQEAMSAWIAELLDKMRSARYVVSVDGKAMRGAGKHILSGFVQDLRLVAMHEEVGEKANELSSLRERLPWLMERYPGLWLLCGDALFAEAKLCELLKFNGRDWLFQIQRNQQHLYEKLELVFAPIARRPPHHRAQAEKKGAASSGAITGPRIGMR
jgi:hypothetical protein